MLNERWKALYAFGGQQEWNLMSELGRSRIRFNLDEMYIFDTRCTHFSKRMYIFKKDASIITILQKNLN